VRLGLELLAPSVSGLTLWGGQSCLSAPGGRTRFRSDVFVCLFVFDSIGVWVQGIALARHELYHLNHASSPFCCYFGDRTLVFVSWPGLPSNYFRLVPLSLMPVGMAGSTMRSIFTIEMGVSQTFLWPETMILLISPQAVVWDDRHVSSLCLTIGRDGVSWAICPG
jgi:hypothetical protein